MSPAYFCNFDLLLFRSDIINSYNRFIIISLNKVNTQRLFFVDKEACFFLDVFQRGSNYIPVAYFSN